MCDDVKTESRRPWAKRADEIEATDPTKHWSSDFAAFREWWEDKVEEIGGPSTDTLFDLRTTNELGFVTHGDVAIYSALCDAFDNQPG